LGEQEVLEGGPPETAHGIRRSQAKLGGSSIGIIHDVLAHHEVYSYGGWNPEGEACGGWPLAGRRRNRGSRAEQGEMRDVSPG